MAWLKAYPSLDMFKHANVATYSPERIFQFVNFGLSWAKILGFENLNIITLSFDPVVSLQL